MDLSFALLKPTIVKQIVEVKRRTEFKGWIDAIPRHDNGPKHVEFSVKWEGLEQFTLVEETLLTDWLKKRCEGEFSMLEAKLEEMIRNVMKKPELQIKYVPEYWPPMEGDEFKRGIEKFGELARQMMAKKLMLNDWDIPHDNRPDEDAISGDEIMGFGKRKAGLPDHIKDVSFDQLQNYQVRAIAHYMGVERDVMRGESAKARRDNLKRFCLDNERSMARAQEAYEMVCLGKKGDDKPPDAGDKRFLELVAEMLRDHDLSIGEKIRDRMDTMDFLKLAKQALKEASESYRPLAIVDEKGFVKRKVKGVMPPEFERMIKLASQRIPIMLVGPAGCGKTYLAEKLGEALGMEFSDQSCSEGMSESVFNGLLLPIGKQGEFKHVTSPFMDRYEGGGVMLLDEIDAGDPNLFTYINKAIANSSYSVSQRWTKPVVKKHSDFVLIAAANTYGHGADAMYVGRNQLDAATLDRFKVGLITMDYSREVELTLGDKELCEWAWKIRENIRRHKLRRIMSTRVIENLGKMTVAYKWDRKEWAKAYFTGWPENEQKLALEGVAT